MNGAVFNPVTLVLCRLACWRWLVCACLLVAWSLPGWSAVVRPAPLVITGDSTEYQLGRHLGLLEDPEGRFSFDQISEPGGESRFTPSTVDVPGFGFSSSVFWARFELDYQDVQNDAWFLELAYPPMQWIDVYTVTERFEVTAQHGGSGVPHAERPFSHHSHVFKLRLNPGDKLTVYVRIAGESSKTLPLVLRRSDAFASYASIELFILGTYFGVMIGLVLYNLFIFNSVREISYIWYILFLISFAAMALTIHGIAPQHLWPAHPHWTMHAVPLLMAVTVMLASLFTIEFIDTRSLSPVVHRVMVLLVVICVPVLLVSVTADYHPAILMSAGVALIYPVVLMWLGVYAVMRNNVSARYYLLAWSFLLAGSFASALRAFSWIPSSFLADYGAYLGSAAEAILLSIALAARVRWLRDEKDIAQQKLLSTLRQQSDLLEDQVAQRTHELLKMQREMVAKDRLASMGVLTAGVVNEIQNPAHFIKAGVQNIAATAEDMASMIDEQEPGLDQGLQYSLHERIAAINGQLTLVEEGGRRIASIVDGLRVITTLNHTEQCESDVVCGLEQALALMESTYGKSIRFNRDIVSRPRILCWPEELAQVFMSLLRNACQGIEERQQVMNDDAPGNVRVHVQQKGRDLWINIEDDGIGMSAETAERAFDPFFTTREVGMGAGLGLTLSRDIIQKHGGKILLMSEPGSGTMVRIILPVVSE